jgi:tRNA threonylcarbamoyl adenosine modification protein YeaZ
MKILALDFSSSQRSVAVVQTADDAEILGQCEVVEAGGRSTRAFRLIQRALTEAHLEREAIECLAVGLGPGSYTGIRASIALAQGWQLARPIRVCGLSTIEVLAAQAQAQGWRGRVHLAVDAQRGEFYLSNWEIRETGRTETGALRLVTRHEVESLLSAGEVVAGPDLKHGFAGCCELFPSAARLGCLAAAVGSWVPGQALEPVYLRPTTFAKAPPPRPL